MSSCVFRSLPCLPQVRISICATLSLLPSLPCLASVLYLLHALSCSSAVSPVVSRVHVLLMGSSLVFSSVSRLSPRPYLFLLLRCSLLVPRRRCLFWLLYFRIGETLIRLVCLFSPIVSFCYSSPSPGARKEKEKDRASVYFFHYPVLFFPPPYVLICLF